MMPALGRTWGAEGMTTRQLQSAYKRQKAASERYRDKHGIIGRNLAQEKAAAYSWELYRRGERTDGQ